MFLTALIVFLVLLVLAMIIYAATRPTVVVADPIYSDGVEDETITNTVTTTSTTVTQDAPAQYYESEPEYTVVGDLTRKKARNGQFYVMDPADKAKIYVNDTDDLYRDAEGKVWRLV